MNFPSSTLRILLRVFASGFGLMAVIWGIWSFPIFNATVGIDMVASRIAADEPFKANRLLAVLPTASDLHFEGRARSLRDLAIIQFRLTELDIAGSGDHMMLPDDKLKLEAAVSRALEKEPSDAYLWLILFWSRIKKDGLTDANLSALRLSYLCGPHEGWLAVTRNRLVMGIYAFLPKDIQDEAVTEFELLVASGYADETAAIFAGPAWPIHDRLLARITTISGTAKQQFATSLYRLNDSIAIEGVHYPEHQH